MKDMKSLLQHINESNITSLKNSILDIISALPDDVEDVEQIKALRKIRSVLDTTNRKSLEEFDEILKQKSLISQNKQITDIIVNTGDFNNIVNVVKDENNLITFDDILANNNFMSLFTSVFSDKDIHEKTFKKLAKYCPQIKRTSCGEFEILLALLCKDAKHPAVGDLSIDGKTIELKNGSGQFVGQGIWTIDTKLPKEFNDYFTRLGYLLANSKELVRIGMLHPMRSAYFDYKDLDVRPGNGLEKLEKVLQMFPDLKFLGHSQRFWDEISNYEYRDPEYKFNKGKVIPGGRVVELMRKYPNLLGDLSADSGYNAMTRDPEFTYAFMEEFADRLYFGTDICHNKAMSQPLVKLAAFLDNAMLQGKISYDTYYKISRGNAEKLLGLTK